MKATAFVPGSIGNVGPGFDVLGLAFEGLGDTVTVELTSGEPRVDAVTGRDAELIPLSPWKNVASIAAETFLRNGGIDAHATVTIEKGLAYAGGMGGSAASAVGGAYAAALAAGVAPTHDAIIRAALEGEASAAGRHLDNIAPSAMGGLTLVLSVDPVDVIRIDTPPSWSVVLITPHVRIETRSARSILPTEWDRASWIQQMANTTALALAFSTGDTALVGRALDDLYAEPRRSPLIPNFAEVKKAALENGALGCSISGSGPTIFAITDGINQQCAAAMAAAAGACDVHVGRIAREGARRA